MRIKRFIVPFLVVIIAIAVIIITCVLLNNVVSKSRPEDVFNAYISYLQNEQYEQMYNLLDEKTRNDFSLDVFVSRNKNIYKGIEATNITVTNMQVNEDEKNGTAEITYNMSMDTIAGNISFANKVTLSHNAEKNYRLAWSSNVIYPDLDDSERVRVGTTEAKRGNIYDRNNVFLAGEGVVSSVGLVPGKMGENKEESIKKLAELLDITVEKINSNLSASYVAPDTFVAMANVAKDDTELKDKLLQIPGVMITDAKARVYPYAKEIAHLLGYVQNITKEELEENPNKGYTANSIIGKSGIEKLYEDKLKGKNGAEIYITDSQGNRIQTIAKIDVQNGENIKLTIDMRIQNYVYEEFKDDKAGCVIIEPKTGEVLALCSTPSYDTNAFVLGMSNNKWNTLTNDENKPLYSRYSASYAPGSSFKPIIGAIALDTKSITADEDFGASGKKWQNNSSWGTYYVTTLKEYGTPANLANALINSDNIYFAKTALKIGEEKLKTSLNKLGFGKSIEFEQSMTASTYANNDTFESEIQLADTGYGQGKVLVNPVHIASIYSSFVNDGNMIKPYIIYKQNIEPEYYVENAFTKETANIIKQDLIQVVENPNGTAYSARINGKKIAGKTGTAEIKASQDDKTGTEIGWFNAFTADDSSNGQFLIISMVEDVKDKGGSHYLLPKVKSILQKII